MAKILGFMICFLFVIHYGNHKELLSKYAIYSTFKMHSSEHLLCDEKQVKIESHFHYVAVHFNFINRNQELNY